MLANKGFWYKYINCLNTTRNLRLYSTASKCCNSSNSRLLSDFHKLLFLHWVLQRKGQGQMGSLPSKRNREISCID